MIKKIIIAFILIYILISPISYGTDEIISSQMEALNLSTFIKEGKNYTQDVFPDLNLDEFLNSAIKGEIDNNSIFKDILSLFGNEILTALSLLGSILIIIVIHSILKSFTDNLKNEGIGQIAYYVTYILIVTVIMANFSSVINMINESISNLVGYINCLIPILLALMTASRKYSFCFTNTTNNNFCSCIYRKYNNFIYITSNSYCNSIGNCI